MRINQLRDFLAILEGGSIRRAARQLNVSQPALTKGLRQLESELGVRLFQRLPTGVVPTNFGRVLSARARAISAELKKAEEEIGQLSGSQVGSVSFGVGTAVAIRVVPDAVHRFRQQYPNARVQIAEGLPHVLVPKVRDETLDFAVCTKPTADIDSSLQFRPLFHSRRVIVARKGHPLLGATSIAELADSHWIGLPPFGTWSSDRWGTIPLILKNACQLIECESFNALIALIISSDMIAIISQRLLDDPHLRDLIQEIDVQEQLPTFSVGTIFRRGIPLTPTARAMSRAISSLAQNLERMD